MTHAWTLLIAPFLSLFACRDDSRPTHVACVGDSITVGDGATAPQETYPAALQGMLGHETQVQAFGHSGATALGAGAGNLPYDAQPEYAEATDFVSRAGPDARVGVVILLGANDSKPANWDLPGRRERFRADYTRLIEHFAALPTHPTVYLASPVSTGDHPCCDIRGEVLTSDIAPIVRDIAAGRSLPLIDLTTPTRGHPELLVDGVHPNDRGYQGLATTVYDALLANPPKPQPRSAWWRRLPFLE